MKKISVDFDSIVGRIKPLHGVNNAARKTDYGELLDSFKELRVPFSRLHDTGGVYGGSRYVDVANVFPDFAADEDDPASYDFTLTDCYIKPLVEAGIQVFYRLGATIEHEPKKYRTYPPSDPAKWARVCEHIVRHYNKGWADGFEWGIRYWEVWNEPDGLDPRCEPFGCPNWQGTAAQYYELYCLTAKEIKSRHPEALVGGYSSCYVLGSFRDGGWFPGDTSFFTGFLEYVRDNGAPLDFFSWHGYLGKQYIDKVKVESDFVDETLRRYGFGDALRFDTEWNCNIHDSADGDRRTENYVNYRGVKGASHCAAAMFKMQRCRIDAAMYYDAQIWYEYGGLYEVPSLRPSKAWHALKAFGELYELGGEARSNDDGLVYACAATDGKTRLLCLANIDDEPLEVSLDCGLAGEEAEITTLDENEDFDIIRRAPFPEKLIIGAFSVVRIKTERRA